MFVVREEDRLIDIKKKILIIKTIIQQCEQLTNNPVALVNSLDATLFLTNEPKKIIEDALRNSQTREIRSLIESYQELKCKVEKSRILSCHIHNILYDNYVNERHLPKLDELCNALDKHGVTEYPFEVLKTRGYIWKKLSGDKCILIEDPEVQAKRIKYLVDMKRFRQNNRVLVFVEQKAIPADVATYEHYVTTAQFPDTGTYKYVKIAGSPQIGVLALSMNNSETFTDWLKNDVVPHLKNSYVLVLEENSIKEAPINQPPNAEAKKEDMIEWLERNDIPCSSSMHRAELYELIDIFKDKLGSETTLIEEYFKTIGVELLKRPEGWPMLNFFEPIWGIKAIWNSVEDGDVAETLGKRIEMMVDMFAAEKFPQYNNNLEATETDVYEKDMELEEVIDKLFTMAKDVEIPDVGLPNYSEVKGDSMEKYVKIFSGALDPTVKKETVIQEVIQHIE